MSDKIMPVLIVKPNSLSRRDIARMEKAGFILVVECKEPEACRFLEPPSSTDIEPQARAALSLIRQVVNHSNDNPMWDKNTIGNWWAQILMAETKPKTVEKVKT